jgi:hypothetical protein
MHNEGCQADVEFSEKYRIYNVWGSEVVKTFAYSEYLEPLIGKAIHSMSSPPMG